MTLAQDMRRIRTTISYVGKLLIRTADELDIPDIIRLSREMHAEGPYSSIEFDEHKVGELGIAMSHPHSNYWGAVAEDDGKVVGVIIGVCEELLFSRRTQTFDVIIYVSKDARGSTAGLRLINAYIDWAKSIDAVACNVVISGMYDNSKTYLLVQKLGFSPVGGLFKMQLGE